MTVSLFTFESCANLPHAVQCLAVVLFPLPNRAKSMRWKTSSKTSACLSPVARFLQVKLPGFHQCRLQTDVLIHSTNKRGKTLITTYYTTTNHGVAGAQFPDVSLGNSVLSLRQRDSVWCCRLHTPKDHISVAMPTIISKTCVYSHHQSFYTTICHIQRLPTFSCTTKHVKRQ